MAKFESSTSSLQLLKAKEETNKHVATALTKPYVDNLNIISDIFISSGMFTLGGGG